MTDPVAPALPDPNAWWKPRDVPHDRGGPVGHPFTPPRPDLRTQPLFDSFSAIVARQPDLPALRSPARVLSYAEAHGAARALAARIAAAAPDRRRVAVVLGDDIDVALALLACWACGGIPLLVNANQPAARIARTLDSACPDLLLADPGSVAAHGAACPVLDLAGPRMPSAEFHAAGMETPAAVVFTSGSTGEPKGIARTQAQIAARADLRIRQFHLDGGEPMLVLYPLSNGLGTTALATALTQGLELCVAGLAGTGLRAILEMAAARSVRILFAIPSLLRTLLAVPGGAPAVRHVRGVLLSSEPVTHTDIVHWRQVLAPGCALETSYGLTEGAPMAAWFIPPGISAADGPLALGYPSGWYEFAITDEGGRAVAAGAEGELWARGDLLAAGEWRNGEIVPGRLIVDPEDPARRILRTGDIVRLGADGMLRFVGRADAMLKIRGNRVQPAAVEDALRRVAGVAEAAVVAEQASGETRMAAFVLPAAGARLDRAGLLAALRDGLPAYMVPGRVEIVQALPRLPNGKIDARRLTGEGA